MNAIVRLGCLDEAISDLESLEEAGLCPPTRLHLLLNKLVTTIISNVNGNCGGNGNGNGNDDGTGKGIGKVEGALPLPCSPVPLASQRNWSKFYQIGIEPE